MILNVGKTLYVNNRKEWWDWLSTNFDKEKEIWLLYPSKNSGKKRIEYTMPSKKPCLSVGLTAPSNIMMKIQRRSVSLPETPIAITQNLIKNG